MSDQTFEEAVRESRVFYRRALVKSIIVAMAQNGDRDLELGGARVAVAVADSATKLLTQLEVEVV